MVVKADMEPMRDVTDGGVNYDVWLRATQAMLLVRARGTSLAVGFQTTDSKKWIAFALETDKRTYRDILDSHAHAVIGEFRSEKAAMKAAEAYAKKWKAGKIKKAKDCECEEIVAEPKLTAKQIRNLRQPLSKKEVAARLKYLGDLDRMIGPSSKKLSAAKIKKLMREIR